MRHCAYKGNLIESGEVICENGEWIAYQTKEVQGWKTIKLVCKSGKHAKANFWLAWNGERFAKGKVLLILIEHHKPIHDWLLMYLTENFDG